MKQLLIFLIVLFAGKANALNSTEASSLFDEAGQAYESGDYQKAYGLYQQIATDYSSFELEYNLGNTCLKLDSIAAAILHYERAKKINPYDEDLKTNLQIANQKVADKIEALPTLGVSDLWKNITSESALKWWTALAIICMFIGLGFLSWFVWRKNTLHRRILFFAGILFVLFSLATWAVGNESINRIRENSEAIIFTQKVDIKGSPAAEGTTVFVLHEGTKVNIREKRDDWYEIRIANGSVGWIRVQDVRVI